MEKRALVLGGGGVTGVAWEIGLLHGLAERGVDLTAADLFIGTSAGSVVAAQLTSGVSIPELYARELADTTGDRNATVGTKVLLGFVLAALWPGGRERGRARLGRAALKARTVPESERRTAIASRVQRDDWPAARLLVPAVEAQTGAVTVFDSDSGASLIDAVAASCAVPLVWPPMTVNGKRYIDGGVRSVANVDLAAGYERVVVIAPLVAAARRADRPGAQAAALGAGVRTAVISPTDAALTAIGRNPLDPSRRAPAGEAGRAQAAEVIERVRAVWG
ncbi:patatin-like phospholipase family protein [Actinoplanes friuliensis]|uniref:Putative patatin-like phospholipase n=1 Tax=Actinoplanes friuliensis DSM 7358 TaxID=1246995 RepID=U5W9Y5_9ACTN|nr:patatin-like phospholipase family protein [Actinoplanes friuliensis]AGZ44731.1 putative patatin-like phospholipase [Actinoplanes friuliensis DSM 7358]